MDAGGLIICLRLRLDRLTELSGIADRVAVELPGWCADFGKRVRMEQGWAVP
jgi:hypothetical protein